MQLELCATVHLSVMFYHPIHLTFRNLGT
jgi:hypothetical protein